MSPNRYCNLDGNSKIRESYQNINTGFEKVQGEIDIDKLDIAALKNLSFTGSEHDALVTGALVDMEGIDFGPNGALKTYLQGRLLKWEQKILDHAADIIHIFNPKWVDNFDTDTRSSYTANQTTLSAPDDSIMRVTSINGATDPWLLKSMPSGFDGGINRYILVRYKIISGVFGGNIVYYTTSGHSYSGTYSKSFSLINDGQWHILVLDMYSLNAGGGTDWKDNIINSIRFDYTSVGNCVVDIDFIAVGSAGACDLSNHLLDSVTDSDGAHGLKIESGTWTPTIEGSTTLGANTYAAQTGFYYKTGKMVFVTGRVALTAKDAAMAGNIRIGGLPFTSGNGYFSAAFGLISSLDFTAGKLQLAGLTSSSTTNIALCEVGDNVAYSYVAASQIQGNTDIRFTLTYMTA